MAMLLAAALAAASVGSAATKTSKVTSLAGHKMVKTTWGGAKGANTQTKNGRTAAGQGFAAVGIGQVQKLSLAQMNAIGKSASVTNRPTRVAPSHAKPQYAAAAAAVNIPHIHSLPITHATYDGSAQGITSGWNEAVHYPFGSTPPDQALAEGHGQLIEAVNTSLIVMDANFNHPLAVEPLEGLFASAILATGFTELSDPRALYDGATGRWFLTVVAYGAPIGSAVFIAVSNTSDAQGMWTIYVLDVSFDGTTCGIDGCIGDQPNLGADRYTLDISTNSFDFDSGALNGAQLYVIDKTALAAGYLFPSIWYTDIGATYAYPGTLGNSCGIPNPGVNFGFCLSSVQPANTPNQSFVADHAGTEFASESLDPLATADNRVVLWAITATSGVSFSPPNLSGTVVGTESYGYPVTNNCMVMPQMLFFGLNVNQCGQLEQPADGNLPTCSAYLFFYTGVTGPCEPGVIAAGDDRMQQVTSVHANGPATIWSGLNTDALISDPLGVLHRRGAIAWFSLSATSWGNADCSHLSSSGLNICSGGVNGQGYVGNWQNDVTNPSLGIVTSGVSGALVYSVTGNNTYPSVAVSKVAIHAAVGSIPIVVQGDNVLDDVCTDVPVCGFASPNPETFYRPRFGDYSAATSDGNSIWLASEYASDVNRGFVSNWATGLVRTHS